MSQLKRTPIYSAYEEFGAKIIDFGGWEMPVSFSGIIKEHEAVRNQAGLFDVSHMGEIMVEGKDSLLFLQRLMTNNVNNLAVNKAQYSFMCNEDGGTIDDLLIYQLEKDMYMLVVNAANIVKDITWLKRNLQDESVTICDKSDDYGLLAVQGPYSESILQQITLEDVPEITPFRFKQHMTFTGIKHDALVSRTGYTGEDGFEIYIHKDSALPLWQLLLKEGKDKGLIPAGLGARDSLRFEAGLPLYGQELSETISPIEARLTFAVKMDKDGFIGQEVLNKQKTAGTERTLVGLELLDKGIARTGHEILNESNDLIGIITTGTKSPTLNKAIAFAMIQDDYSEIGQTVMIRVRKKFLKAKIIKTPFYTR